MKNKRKNIEFWDIAKEYLFHYLPDIRKTSVNTISSYRDGLNYFIDFLEEKKYCVRKKITFENFDRDTLKNYMDWMLNERNLAPKTCNLRLTAIHSLLEYSSNESIALIPIYLNSCTVKAIKVTNAPIEFFEQFQMKALLSAPNTKRKVERRNQMMLIVMYDAATRVSELLNLKISSLHLDSATPFISIFGKGRKYRNVPLMNKTIEHLKHYIKEFHSQSQEDCPLFYAVTHGKVHELSVDTMQKMVKRYAAKCSISGLEMPKKSHCHMIRKTRAMDLYQSGVPLAHIQQLLGHANISTTSGFYVFATLDTLAKSMRNQKEIDTEKIWDNKNVLNQIYRL